MVGVVAAAYCDTGTCLSDFHEIW